MSADPARAGLTLPSPGREHEAHAMEMKCVEEQRAAQRINLSVDLVLAAKRHLGLLRTIDSLPCLHRGPAVMRAIQRCLPSHPSLYPTILFLTNFSTFRSVT